MSISKFIKDIVDKSWRFVFAAGDLGTQQLPAGITEDIDEKMINYIHQNSGATDASQIPPVPEQWLMDPNLLAWFNRRARDILSLNADNFMSMIVQGPPASIGERMRQDIDLTENEQASHRNANIFFQTQAGKDLIGKTPNLYKRYYKGDEEIARSDLFESVRRFFEGRVPGDEKDNLKYRYFLEMNKRGFDLLKLQPALWQELNYVTEQALGMDFTKAAQYWNQLPGGSAERKEFSNRLYEILGNFESDKIGPDGTLQYYGINSIIQGIMESGSPGQGEIHLDIPPDQMQNVRNYILKDFEYTARGYYEDNKGMGPLSLDDQIGDDTTRMDILKTKTNPSSEEDLSVNDPQMQAILHEYEETLENPDEPVQDLAEEAEEDAQQIEQASTPQEKARLITQSALDNLDNLNDIFRSGVISASQSKKVLTPGKYFESVMPDVLYAFGRLAEKLIPQMEDRYRETGSGVKEQWSMGGTNKFGYDLLAVKHLTDIYGNKVDGFVLDGVPSFQFDDKSLADEINAIIDFKQKAYDMKYNQGLDAVTAAQMMMQENPVDPDQAIKDMEWAYAQIEALGGEGAIDNINKALAKKKTKSDFSYLFSTLMNPFFRDTGKGPLYKSMNVDVRQAILGIFPNRSSIFAGVWPKPTKKDENNPKKINTQLQRAIGWSSAGFKDSPVYKYYQLIGMPMPKEVEQQWKHYEFWQKRLIELTGSKAKKGEFGRDIKVASRDYVLYLAENYLKASRRKNEIKEIGRHLSFAASNSLIEEEISNLESLMGDLYGRICDECGYT